MIKLASLIALVNNFLCLLGSALSLPSLLRYTLFPSLPSCLSLSLVSLSRVSPSLYSADYIYLV